MIYNYNLLYTGTVKIVIFFFIIHLCSCVKPHLSISAGLEDCSYGY